MRHFLRASGEFKKEGRSVLDYLDSLYLQYGYFLESLGQIVYEGWAGAAKIENILKSYRSNPPTEFMDANVSKVYGLWSRDRCGS